MFMIEAIAREMLGLPSARPQPKMAPMKVDTEAIDARLKRRPEPSSEGAPMPLTKKARIG